MPITKTRIPTANHRPTRRDPGLDLLGIRRKHSASPPSPRIPPRAAGSRAAVFVLSVLVFAVPWPRPRVWIPLVMLIVLVGSLKYVRWTLATEQRASFKSVCQRELPAIFDAVAEPGERIGAFDSGALGYLAPRPVVNLDGLVNAELVGLLRSHDGRAWDRKYRDYLLRKQITIFVGGTGYS